MTHLPQYRPALRALREECPCLLPVRVRFLRTTRGTRRCAFAALNAAGAGFNITIFGLSSVGRALTDSELEDVIVHEWAHCRSWTPAVPGDVDHGPAWGLAYAECYRAAIAD